MNHHSQPKLHANSEIMSMLLQHDRIPKPIRMQIGPVSIFAFDKTNNDAFKNLVVDK
jgi:hypothetical protein